MEEWRKCTKGLKIDSRLSSFTGWCTVTPQKLEAKSVLQVSGLLIIQDRFGAHISTLLMDGKEQQQKKKWAYEPYSWDFPYLSPNVESLGNIIDCE